MWAWTVSGARMDVVHKAEVEKLLYAALVSTDTTRDWPNCSRVWNVRDQPCRVPATRTVKSISVFDFWCSTKPRVNALRDLLGRLAFSWCPRELIRSTFAQVRTVVSSTFSFFKLVTGWSNFSRVQMRSCIMAAWIGRLQGQAIKLFSSVPRLLLYIGNHCKK